MTTGADTARTQRALAALAVDPGGLKGLTFRARMGPARQAFETTLGKLPGPQHRIHPAITDDQLFGGLNIAASLAEGRPIRDAGLADQSSTLVLTMAERTPSGLAARLAQLLDADHGHALILLDEAASAEEGAPQALLDRLAFHIEPPEAATPVRLPAAADLDAARKRLSRVQVPADALPQLVTLAARFGIHSLRAPSLALRAARALAALDAEMTITEDHLQEAAELVYPSRATMMPAEAEDETPPDAPEADQSDNAEENGDQSLTDLPDDILVSAIAALLPPDILDRLAAKSTRPANAAGSGAGDRRRGNRRGRPLPSRPGRPSAQARIDPIATLRAAAPWQTLRRTGRNADRALLILPSDIRIKRFEDRSDRLLIFTVDASGSAAVARLAEAKGAVELMLAQAYARRDQVALLAFRGTGTETLLPPTRSLVQAKRRLASLPGGGGTPLASGLMAAGDLAHLARGRGLTPMLVLLTDGRANVPLSGEPDRAAANDDATRLASSLRQQGLSGVLVDTSNRPTDAARTVAATLGARYLALPRADAHGISTAVTTALEA
ncbi:magnesium chelatase subunit D [Roseovarius atlanticus]|uniref:magnesium chelatase subunit D n=1 Tax=Roseovarius atlanticus TaxID=1641875 RepID=UPI001C98827D|nr:magnesium chelatase subunit D [Roseovarius atlanticus]MBY5990447.1 magnesium chelatase subunit D [Roseovarius atlanticus]MBY6126993.1 magnesium chelatase subunit D [Roseovarius atlanticus]MBY6151486.1 magnesium chelatase subunit D [Roseovarius atlanticus]